MSRTANVSDLVSAVHKELGRRKLRPPKPPILQELFDGLYSASLRTEESERLKISVVYLNPTRPDPTPPERVRLDRWRYFRLTMPLKWDAANLTKLARASDPRSSSLAVYPNKDGELFIWGLVDQQNEYHNFLNFNSDSGPERPGLFQAETSSVGNIRVAIQYEKAAELKIDRLLQKQLEVFQKGPISKLLRPGISKGIARIERRLLEERGWHLHNPPGWRWMESLCRLLFRVQGYRHGGAVIITPDNSREGLRVKYDIQYDRIRTGIESRVFFDEVQAALRTESMKILGRGNCAAQFVLR